MHASRLRVYTYNLHVCIPVLICNKLFHVTRTCQSSSGPTKGAQVVFSQCAVSAMASLPFGMPYAEFKDASFMLEAYWWQQDIEHVKGVFTCESSNISNRSKRPADFRVFFQQDVRAGCILGLGQGTYMGFAGEVWPDSQMCGTMQEFLHLALRGKRPYHGWAGFSWPYPTECGTYHAVDWYPFLYFTTLVCFLCNFNSGLNHIQLPFFKYL